MVLKASVRLARFLLYSEYTASLEDTVFVKCLVERKVIQGVRLGLSHLLAGDHMGVVISDS